MEELRDMLPEKVEIVPENIILQHNTSEESERSEPKTVIIWFLNFWSFFQKFFEIFDFGHF